MKKSSSRKPCACGNLMYWQPAKNVFFCNKCKNRERSRKDGTPYTRGDRNKALVRQVCSYLNAGKRPPDSLLTEIGTVMYSQIIFYRKKRYSHDHDRAPAICPNCNAKAFYSFSKGQYSCLPCRQLFDVNQGVKK